MVLELEDHIGNVVVSRSSKQAYTQSKRSSEHITMRVAVSADKIPLSPFLIFQRCYTAGPYAWLRPENALYRVWTNGYMDTELFCLWLKKLYIPMIARIPKPILLTCDGHHSHLDVKTIDIFVDQNIHLYCYHLTLQISYSLLM